MSQQQLFRFVSILLPSWRKTRRRVLCLGAQGLIAKRRLTLSSLARGMESPCRVIHRVKRLWRFTNNSAVDPREATQALTQQAFRARAGRWVPVILDETGLKDRAMLLGAAVSYRGRALPRGLFAYSPQLLKKSLWALRLGLLAVILQALPAEGRARLLLVADRGYAASHFFGRLLSAHLAFVIRVPRKVLLHMACGDVCLETLAADLNPGDFCFLKGVAYGPLRARLNLVLCWDPGQPEPWLLATTLRSGKQARRYYRLRMRIEELFKDLKGRFGLEACQLETLTRITRVCLFVLLALWALALLVRYPSHWPRFVTTRGALSFLSLALEWLDAPPPLRHAIRAGPQSG
jgi:hypothetical protein